MTTATTKTIAFFGASGGCGLSALKTSLAAGHSCIALCRTAAKLEAIILPAATPNLTIVQGNAHDAAAVAQCLRARDGRLVDTVVFTIGGRFIASKMTLDDPEVCRKGIAVVLDALTQLRKEGVSGRPRIVVISTTGVSTFKRDFPLAMMPIYSVMLRVPHADKRAMEERLCASSEDFTIVRPSILVEGSSGKPIRVGIEDPAKGIESSAVGYAISRDDTGKWIAENLVLRPGAEYLGKAVSITY